MLTSPPGRVLAGLEGRPLGGSSRGAGHAPPPGWLTVATSREGRRPRWRFRPGWLTGTALANVAPGAIVLTDPPAHTLVAPTWRRCSWWRSGCPSSWSRWSSRTSSATWLRTCFWTSRCWRCGSGRSGSSALGPSGGSSWTDEGWEAPLGSVTPLPRAPDHLRTRHAATIAAGPLAGLRPGTGTLILALHRQDLPLGLAALVVVVTSATDLRPNRASSHRRSWNGGRWLECWLRRPERARQRLAAAVGRRALDRARLPCCPRSGPGRPGLPVGETRLRAEVARPPEGAVVAGGGARLLPGPLPGRPGDGRAAAGGGRAIEGTAPSCRPMAGTSPGPPGREPSCRGPRCLRAGTGQLLHDLQGRRRLGGQEPRAGRGHAHSGDARHHPPTPSCRAGRMRKRHAHGARSAQLPGAEEAAAGWRRRPNRSAEVRKAMTPAAAPIIRGRGGDVGI